jgi:hypothetical protein
MGMGCNKCSLVEFLLKEIAAEGDIDLHIDYSDEIETFIQYKIEKTPALLLGKKTLSFDDEVDKAAIRAFLTENAN